MLRLSLCATLQKELAIFFGALTFSLGACAAQPNYTATLVRGLNPAAEAKPVSMDDLATIVDLPIVSVSSTGRFAAVLERFPTENLTGYKQNWIIFDLNSPEEPVAVIDAGEPRPAILANGYKTGGFEPRAPKWRADDAQFLFTKRQGGRDGLALLNLDTGRVIDLAPQGGDVLFAEWSESNKTHIYYFAAEAVKERAYGGARFQSGFMITQSWTPLRPPARPEGFNDFSFAKYAKDKFPLRMLNLSTDAERMATPAEKTELLSSIGVTASADFKASLTKVNALNSDTV